jgi:hypothetical protein
MLSTDDWLRLTPNVADNGHPKETHTSIKVTREVRGII